MRCECDTAEFSGSVRFSFSRSSKRRVHLSALRPYLSLCRYPFSRSRPNNLEPYSYKPCSVQSYSDCLRASIDRRVCVNSSISAVVIARMRYLYHYIIFIFIYNIYLYVLLFTASKICPSKCTVGYNPDRSYIDARTRLAYNKLFHPRTQPRLWDRAFVLHSFLSSDAMLEHREHPPGLPSCNRSEPARLAKSLVENHLLFAFLHAAVCCLVHD